ncbi:uncharacterized protein [Battus philenor]|uniref:uncharacterized protein n=1 Tax=Battus philenor TaxID=42288 RepID=UPI0035D04DA7
MENQDNDQTRKRGRPTGKNRRPLNKEERRARNAQYERERREDMARARIELADAVGADHSISLPALISTVLNILRESSQIPSLAIHTMREQNDSLSREIQRLESSPAEKDNEK